MVRRKTHEEFVAEVKALVGDEYRVLGEYKNSMAPVEMEHVLCGNIYTPTPNKFLRDKQQGKRCRVCIGTNKGTTEGFKDYVQQATKGEYEVLGEYTYARDPISVKHLACNHTYLVNPNNFKRGNRCPKCFGKNKKTTEIFKREVNVRVGSEYEVLGEYVNDSTHITMEHKNCGSVYQVTPSNFLNGKRCPVCLESKGERRIRDFLVRNDVEFESQYPIKYSERKPSLKLDFLVQGVAIEYDGELHYMAVKFFGGEDNLRKTQRRDRIKDKYCADNGIPLIRIPYWDFDNIDAILTEKLLPLLIQEYSQQVG